MAVGINISMLGDKVLARKLKSLAPKLQKKIVRNAMRKAIKPVAAQAKANAPVLSGTLQLSLRVAARKFKSRTKFGIQVATDKLGGDIYYAAFNELGTKKQPARPFMRPALHGNRERSTGILKREIASGIVRAGKG